MLERIAIIGASGFLGQNIASGLAEEGFKIIKVGRSSSCQVYLEANNPESGLNQLAELDVDAVINLVGSSVSGSSTNRFIDYAINAEFPFLLTKFIANLKKPPILFHAASALELLEPKSVSNYVQSKIEGTSRVSSFARPRNFQLITLFIHNCYGPGQPINRFVASVIYHLRNQEVLLVEQPFMVRDFVFIKDVTEVFKQMLINHTTIPQRVEVRTGVQLNLIEAVRIIANEANLDFKCIRFASKETESYSMLVPTPLKINDLGHCPTLFREGIRITLESE